VKQSIKCFLPSLGAEEQKSIIECLSSGNLGFGKEVIEFEKKFEKFSNKKFNVGVSSASAAAYILFAYFKRKYGVCDVYVPSLTFTSPVWAAKETGHNIIFVDVDENLLFSAEDYKSKRYPNSSWLRKTIIMPVLYGGVGNIPNFDLIGDEIVVVDSAHSITPKIKSDFIFFSFHSLKPICMSNGGMISCDDEESSEYFRKYRNFGRENIEHTYDITQEGFNFYLNNLNASLGLAQMKKAMKNIQTRKRNYLEIKDGITEKAGHFLKHDKNSSYYLSTLILNEEEQEELSSFMLKHGICSSYHYPPLHKTKFYKRTPVTLKNTEKMYKKIINLPIHQNLSDRQLQDIIECVNAYFKER
jgi:perosamine synthetase